MSQEKENQDEIKRLIEELTNALNTMNNVEKETQIVCEETLFKLKQLNVEADIVRKIIKRSDEMYGRTDRFNTSLPLYEEFNNLTNKNK